MPVPLVLPRLCPWLQVIEALEGVILEVEQFKPLKANKACSQHVILIMIFDGAAEYRDVLNTDIVIK